MRDRVWIGQTWRRRRDKREFTVRQVHRPDRIPDLVHSLSRAGARVTRVEPHEPTLEDLYFAVRQISGRSRLGAVDGSTV